MNCTGLKISFLSLSFILFSGIFTNESKSALTDASEFDSIEISNEIKCLEKMQGNAQSIFSNPKLSSYQIKKLESNFREACSQLFISPSRIAQKTAEEKLILPLSNYLELASLTIGSSLLLKESVLEAQISRDAYNAAIATKNPQLEFSIDASVYSENYFECADNDDLEIGVGCYTVRALSPYNKPFNYYQIGDIDDPVIELSYEVFNLQKNKMVESKEEDFKMNNSKVIDDYDKQIVNVFKTYDQISKAEQQLIIRKAIDILYQESLSILEDQLKSGFTTIVDVQKLKTKLQHSRATVAMTESQLSELKATINNQISKYNKGVETQLFISNPFYSLEWKNTDELLANAIKRSPDIESLEYEAMAYKYQSDSQLANLLPSVNISFGYSPQLTGVLYQGVRQAARENSFVGSIGINWKIFDSRLSQINSSSALKRMKAAQLKLNQLIIQKSNDIQAKSRSIGLGELDLSNKYNAVSSATKAMSGAKVRLAAGFEDVTSFIQTVDSLLASQLEFYQSIYNQNKLFRDLAFESYSLDESGINQLVTTSVEQDINDQVTLDTPHSSLNQSN